MFFLIHFLDTKTDLEFIAKGETGKMPKLLHRLNHDRINMEFAEACMRAIFWHADNTK